MKMDLNKGVFIQISGEVGKYNTLPIDFLVKFAQELQELIKTLAKYDLPSNEAINLDNFQIELTDFKKGSAVPKFAFSQRTEKLTGINWQVHRNAINDKFEKLIEVSNKGDYSQLKEIYPEPSKRNPIVEQFYGFTNAFGTTPVSFVDYEEKQNKVIPLYKINKFKSSIKKDLTAEIIEEKPFEESVDEGFGKIKTTTTKSGKKKRQIMSFYSKKNIALEFAPEVIIVEDRKYILKHPLRCLFEKDDDYFVIQNEMLDIIGTGLTEDDAEKSFCEEFDYIYQRYNALKDEQLTQKIFLAKTILNQIVVKVE